MTTPLSTAEVGGLLKALEDIKAGRIKSLAEIDAGMAQGIARRASTS